MCNVLQFVERGSSAGWLAQLKKEMNLFENGALIYEELYHLYRFIYRAIDSLMNICPKSM